MIVRNDDTRAIAKEVAPGPAELPVLAEIVEHRFFGRFVARDAEAAVDLIDLVAGEKEDVGVLNY